MDGTVRFLRAYRAKTLQVLESVTMPQRLFVPVGYNNNLLWNLAHVIASQQRICYLMAGLKPVVEESSVLRYVSGTRPEASMDEREYGFWSSLAMPTLDRLESDLASGEFGGFAPFTLASYNLEINNVHDALKMVLFHEGFHFGYCAALKRAVVQNT